jgi:putative ABC transport system permease protein
MMADPAIAVIPLDAVDLAVAGVLVLVAGGVSLALRLDLERQLAWASLRTVVQLLLIGHILTWIFDIDSVPALFAVLAVMIVAAGRAAVQRSSRTYKGVHSGAIVTLAITALITTFTVTAGVIGVDPWYRPQYVIPLLGMVLGNGLTGISLCLDRLLERFSERSDLVEMELALGATRWEAARESVSSAVRTGMIPIINSMMVVGLVSLPGMMTGQILSGTDPVEAVKYQIVVMFMLAGGTSLGCITIALLGYRRLFNERHQLESDRIK